MNFTRKKYKNKNSIIIKSRDKLLKKLRKNRNKYLKQHKIRGGGWFDWFKGPSSIVIKDYNVAGKSVDKIYEGVKELQNIEHSTFETSHNLMNASTTVGNVGLVISNASIPFLAASGIGLPLAGVLFLCKQMAELYVNKIQLKLMFQDLIIILHNCYCLEKLIITTVNIFKEQLVGFIESNHLENEMELKRRIQNMSFDINLKTRIKDKIDLITKLLIKISPRKASKIFDKMFNPENPDINPIIPSVENNNSEMSRLNKAKQYLGNKWNKFSSEINDKYERFFYSQYHKENIIRELGLLNSLFLIYNSQFDWSIQFYEKMANSIDSSGKLLEDIWILIENEEDYTNYLHPKIEAISKEVTNDVEELKSDSKGQQIIDENIEQIKEDINEVTNESENATNVNFTENTDENQIGGYKSKKNKRRYKRNKTHKHKT